MNSKIAEIQKLARSVRPPDRGAMEAAAHKNAGLAKPPGSLGRLEELAIRLAGITGRVENRISKKELLVFCADNGVVREGVACAPQSVTLSQTVNLAKGRTGAAVIAMALGCHLTVCDVGVNGEITEPEVISRKLAYGTNDIAREPAMTVEQAARAILTGAELVSAAVESGADVIGIGEMGIGNTTTSSAVLAALTALPVRTVTGRGGGLTDEGFEKKISVIGSALSLHRPDPGDTVDVLSKVGGFDLASMTGAFLAGAAMRVPMVIDGFISAVAALCAVNICENVRGFLIPSHASQEPGHIAVMSRLGLRPLFDLDMRLGEGSGCPMAMAILEAACAVLRDMASFSQAGIDDGYLEPIRAQEARRGSMT